MLDRSAQPGAKMVTPPSRRRVYDTTGFRISSHKTRYEALSIKHHEKKGVRQPPPDIHKSHVLREKDINCYQAFAFARRLGKPHKRTKPNQGEFDQPAPMRVLILENGPISLPLLFFLAYPSHKSRCFKKT
jgi:hypothetical protein